MNIIHNLILLFLFQFPFTSDQSTDNNSPAVGIIFKSTDGGQTWQDISEGLPGQLQQQGIRREDCFASNGGLYLRDGNEIYHCKTNSTAPFWKKGIFPEQQRGSAPGKAVFETSAGTIFIRGYRGLLKSADRGKTWKEVYTGGWVVKMAESDGVLMATSQYGILRSTDNGENWACVLNEGGVGIDVAPIKGGFAAITYNTESMTRRMRISCDGGQSWQPIDAGLPANDRMASIIQVGEDFLCGHPAGVFRSSDKGKTWRLLLPAIDKKAFNLLVSRDVMYAIPLVGGC